MKSRQFVDKSLFIENVGPAFIEKVGQKYKMSKRDLSPFISSPKKKTIKTSLSQSSAKPRLSKANRGLQFIGTPPPEKQFSQHKLQRLNTLHALKEIQLSNLKLKKTPTTHQRATDVDQMLSQTKSFKKGLNIELQLSKRCQKQLKQHQNLDSEAQNLLLEYEMQKIMKQDAKYEEILSKNKKNNDALPILNKIIANKNLVQYHE